MSNVLSASVELMNGRMKFKGEAGAHAPIYTDYIPPHGDGEAHMPLELFLISLSSCMGATLSAFLHKMGRHVGSLSVQAEGIRRETHPLSFASIVLDVCISSDDATAEELQKLITSAEQTYCPLAAMIKNNVELKTRFTLL